MGKRGAAQIGESLLARGWTLSVAESLTGGLLASRLTSVPGSSKWFRGGAVAYQDQAKTMLLGVAPTLIARAGVASREVAEAMASGVAEALETETALSLTGVAGPGPHGGIPPGRVWVGLCVEGRTEGMRFEFSGERDEVREEAATAAMAALAEALEPTAQDGQGSHGASLGEGGMERKKRR